MCLGKIVEGKDDMLDRLTGAGTPIDDRAARF